MNNFVKDLLANKTRIVAVITLVVLLAQSKGLDLTKYIGADWQNTINNVFALITLIAIGDNGGVKNETVQEVAQSENNTNIAHSETPNLNEQKIEQIKTIINQ